ncbi:MAG: M48 family metalloprotease [Pseudomonadota bacterium]
MRAIRTTLAVLAVFAACIMSGAADARSLIRDAEIERTLKGMSAPIFQAAGLTPSTVDLYIINDRSLNAFVTGGRNILLHTGLLMDLDTPEEVLGVIAHETGHISGGHEARRAINFRNARGPALVGLLLGIAAGVAGGGDAGVALAAGSQGAIQRSLLKFNRAEEASADQAGISYLTRAGIDPIGLLRVIERFRGQEVLSIGNLDPYVLTHPLGTERMSLLERRVAERRDTAFPPNPDREYWFDRMQAKLKGFLRSPERVLERLAELPETEMVLYEKAIALHRVPDPAGAVGAMDRLLALKPNDAFYIELKGQILLESGRATQALPYYRRAVSLALNEPLIKAGLGRNLLQLRTPGTDAEALDVLQDARSDDLADASVLRDLATAYERAGDTGMATLATAERYALVGNVKNAVSLARRAAGILPNGSPGWLRAQDILKLDTGKD